MHHLWSNKKNINGLNFWQKPKKICFGGIFGLFSQDKNFSEELGSARFGS